MILYPAIDLKGGKAVRLRQGLMESATVYGDDPVQIAKVFQKDGAEALHVVDLDAATDGAMTNTDVIVSILKETDIPVSVGGGIRTFARASAMIEAGAASVVVGTIALEEPGLLKQMTEAFGDRITVALDVKDGIVMTRGWTDTSERSVMEVMNDLSGLGARAFLVTDIAKDGMMTGPSIGLYRTLMERTDVRIIASGGIGSLDDIRVLGALGVYGAITGKALYEGKFTLKEALSCSQGV
jgi:phosphoribosylformimino-5-aminoimidazole carboxamide ribotide isomerase